MQDNEREIAVFCLPPSAYHALYFDEFCDCYIFTSPLKYHGLIKTETNKQTNEQINK